LFKYVGNAHIGPHAGGADERVMDGTVCLFQLTVRDRDASTRRQRLRQMPAPRRRNGIVGQATGRVDAKPEGSRSERYASPVVVYSTLMTRNGPEFSRRDQTR
jgi:hypothetical protein